MRILPKYKPFEYQRDAVNLALFKINNCGGVFIMDSTGLGKTITSITLALNLENVKKVLVVSPSKNKGVWVGITSSQNDVEFVVTTGQKLPKDIDFDAIIVDECHNYRNVTASSYRNLWMLIRTQYRIPSVILLSATPFQNNFDEFMNTISLIPFKANTFAYIYLGNIITSIKEASKNINTLKRFKGDAISFQDINRLVENEGVYNAKVIQLKEYLGEFCIRNTRDYIKNKYPFDMDMIGNFPEITQHDKTRYNLSDDLSKLVIKIHKVIGNVDILPMAKYNLNKYTKCNDNYIGMNGIMRSFLLKRLDSSVGAFIESLRRMIESYKVIISQYNDDEFTTITINEDSYTLPSNFFDDCRIDVSTLNELLVLAENCEVDDKSLELINVLSSLDGKTIIFTEYKDTLESVYKLLVSESFRVLSFDGMSDESLLDVIESEFDANQPISNQTNNFDILLCTDVLSEGVNLHRATNLIHYDSKWNPQKTTQRNGRVDRLFANKTIKHNVSIFTFGIDKLIDSIIKFEEKTNNKLVASDMVLDFEWLNYGRVDTKLKYEVGRKYYVEKNDFNKGNTYFGFKLNDGCDLVIYCNHFSRLMRDNDNSITRSYNELNTFDIISEDSFGNNSNIGGKVEYRLNDILGKRRHSYEMDLISETTGIAFNDVVSICNSYLNRTMVDFIIKDIIKMRKNKDSSAIYYTLFNNLLSTQGSMNISYYQVVPDGIWLQS